MAGCVELTVQLAWAGRTPAPAYKVVPSDVLWRNRDGRCNNNARAPSGSGNDITELGNELAGMGTPGGEPGTVAVNQFAPSTLVPTLASSGPSPFNP